MRASARRRLLVVVFLGIGGTTASAQSTSAPLPSSSAVGGTHTDHIIVEANSVRVPATVANSGAGGIHWVRTTPRGSALTTGFEAFSIAGSRWAVVNVGGAVRPVERLTVHSQARIGRGQLIGEPFDYRMYEAGVAFRAAPRLHLTMADQYWHVAGARGHLIKPGLAWVPHRRVSADVGFARSVDGNLDAALVTGRVSIAMGLVTLIGGVADGRGAAELFDLTFRDAADRSLRETFAGVQLQLPRAQMTVAGSDLMIAAVHKRTVTASVKYRLGGR